MTKTVFPRGSKPIETGAAVLIFIGITAGFIWHPALEYTLAMTTLAAITAAVALPLLCGKPLILPAMPGGALALGVLAALTFWGWVCAATSDVPALSLLQAGFYALPLLTALAVLQLPGKDLPRRLVIGLGALFLVIGLGTPVQVALFDLPASDRAEWPLQDPNHLAMALNSGIIFSFALMTKPTTRLIGLGILACDALGLLLTGSRAGFILLLAIVPLLIFALNRNLSIRRKHVGLGIGVLGLTALILQFIRPIKASMLANMLEIVTHPGKATGSRFEIWGDTLRLVAERPLTGFGTGTFPLVFPHLMTPTHLTSGYAAHNDFLQIGAEIGVPGMALYALLGLALLIVTRRALRQTEDPTKRVEMVASVCVMAVIGLQAQIEYMLGVLPLLALWGGAFGIWLRALPKPPAPRSGIWAGRSVSQAVGLCVIGLSAISASQLYAEILLKRSLHELESHHVQAFADHLDEARFWSWDLSAQPYLRAANFHLALLLSATNPSTSAQTVQGMINDALRRNPYLSSAYDAQGHLDESLGKSPEAAWRKGLEIDPRQAGLRLLLLQYYTRTGQGEKMRALIEETSHWRKRMKGPVAELNAHLRLLQAIP